MCEKFQMDSMQYGELSNKKITTQKALKSYIGEILETLKNY